MYKMVVSDFFGALINSEEAIPLSTMIEIDKLRQKGILFCISTSKSARVVIDYNKDFPFIDYVIAFNGSYIYDVVNKKTLYDKSIGVLIIKKIYKLFSDKDICFYTLGSCNYIGEYKDRDFSKRIDNASSFIEENKKNIYKIKICVDTKNEALKIKKSIDSLELKIITYIKNYDNKFFVEIYSNLNSKFLGVERICKLRKINLDEVVSISVSEESCELIKNVGYGTSLSNGNEELKKFSKFISSTNDDKGVEQVIKKLF